MSSAVKGAAPCPREDCDGTVQASAKVYFDVTGLVGDEVTDMEFSAVNDSYDGHPCAVNYELSFYCSNDHELDFVVSCRAADRTQLT